jgi:hypothetical protein
MRPRVVSGPATANSIFSIYLCGIQKGDRRGSNPRPSEPQSDVMGFSVLQQVAKTAYLSCFLCSRLRTVAACCALGGVRSGVKRCRQPLPWYACSHPLPRRAWRPSSDLARAVEVTLTSQRENRILCHLATCGPHMTRQSPSGRVRARARSPYGRLTRDVQRRPRAYPSSIPTCRSINTWHGGLLKPSSRLWRAFYARPCK